MKRKSIAILLGAIVLCGALVYAFTPYSIAPQSGQIEIWRVGRITGNAEYEDVTAQVDLEQLTKLTAACKALRLPFYQQSYSLDTVQYEIDAYYEERPLHFVLGQNSFVYESTPWIHHLHDAQTLIDALDAMLPT